MNYIIKSFNKYKKTYQRAQKDPEGFWAEHAERFTWRKKWDKVLEWDFISHDIQWFMNGKLNITENALDRHLAKQGDKIAIIWEPNDPTHPSVKISYRELHAQVCQFSNVLKAQGVQKGDRVCIYMPMTPEAAIAMLACARIGAIHSVVFGGFSAQSLSDRINDSACKVLVTADGAFRGNKDIKLKDIADEALISTQTITSVIVLKRTGCDVNWTAGRDKWWHEEMKNASTDCEPTEMDSEDTLFILYTSGSTGKPKGVVHTTAGYMIYAHTIVKVERSSAAMR